MTEDQATTVVKKVDTATDRLNGAVRLLKFLAIVNLVISSALVLQVQTRTDKLNDVDKAQEQIQQSVNKLSAIAGQIEEVTPEEQARNAAIAAAVAIVPQIKAILCEEFESVQCEP